MLENSVYECERDYLVTFYIWTSICSGRVRIVGQKKFYWIKKKIKKSQEAGLGAQATKNTFKQKYSSTRSKVLKQPC